MKLWRGWARGGSGRSTGPATPRRRAETSAGASRKTPRKRLRDIGDVRLELERVRQGDAQGGNLRVVLNWTEELKQILARGARGGVL